MADDPVSPRHVDPEPRLHREAGMDPPHEVHRLHADVSQSMTEPNDGLVGSREIQFSMRAVAITVVRVR